MRALARSLAAAASAAVLCLTAGCSETSSAKPPGMQQPTTVATVHIVRAHMIAAAGGTVAVDGVSFSVPPAALDHDTDITLSVGKAPPTGAPTLFMPAGPAVHGDLGGAKLLRGATLTLPLASGVHQAGAGYLDEAAGRWIAVPSTVDATADALKLRVTHMSWYEPWLWALSAVQARLEQFLGRLVGYGVVLRTAPPTCQAAPPGVSVSVTGGRSGDPSLEGCVEADGDGQLRLRLVDNRPYGMVVTPPDGAQQESVSRGGLLAAFYQDKMFSDVGGDFVPAGGEADYVLPATGPEVAATGAFSWKTYTLDTAVGMLLTLGDSGGQVQDAVAAGKVSSTATTVPPGKLANVGKCLGDMLFSDPPASVRDAITTDLECLGELDDIWLAPLSLLQGLITDILQARDAGQDLAVGSSGTVTVHRHAAEPTFTFYVGQWRAHGALLSIDQNMTGVLTYNAGPCPTDPSTLCTGRATMRFNVGPAGVTGVIISADPVDQQGGYFVGNTLRLQRAPQADVIQLIIAGGPAVNTNFCGPRADNSTGICGQ